jgi:glyoxylase-like metal-dependent hydrolase (beta-lactamase superfamily II)
VTAAAAKGATATIPIVFAVPQDPVSFGNLPEPFDVDAAFDRLFAEGDMFKIGSLSARVVLSPGHTLASITYVVGDDSAFVHDTLMYPDSGTSRADFPGGDAGTLYHSIQAIWRCPAPPASLSAMIIATRDASQNGSHPWLSRGRATCRQGRDP